MTLAPKRNILLATLGLGMVAVGFDRLVLGEGVIGPKAASAELIDASSIQASLARPPATAESPSAALPPQKNPIVHQLALLAQSQDWDLDNLTDAFSPPNSWILEADPIEPAVSRVHSSADFQQRHRVEAVVVKEGTGYATVDGITLRIGQTLDGFKLISVDQRSVLFESDGIQAELKIRTAEARH